MRVSILYTHKVITIRQYITALMKSFEILEILYNKYSKIMIISSSPYEHSIQFPSPISKLLIYFTSPLSFVILDGIKQVCVFYNYWHRRIIDMQHCRTRSENIFNVIDMNKLLIVLYTGTEFN